MSKIPELNVEELEIKFRFSETQQWTLRHIPKKESSIKVTHLPLNIPLHRMGDRRENNVKKPPDYDAVTWLLVWAPPVTYWVTYLSPPTFQTSCSLQAKVIISFF